MHQCLYFGLGVVCYWRASSWPTSETYTSYKRIYSWIVVGMLVGAVVLKLSHLYQPWTVSLWINSWTRPSTRRSCQQCPYEAVWPKQLLYLSGEWDNNSKHRWGLININTFRPHAHRWPGVGGASPSLRSPEMYRSMMVGIHPPNWSRIWVPFSHRDMTPSDERFWRWHSVMTVEFKYWRARCSDHRKSSALLPCCCIASLVLAPLSLSTSMAISFDCMITITWWWNSKASRPNCSSPFSKPSSNALSKTIWRQIPCLLSSLKTQRATFSISPMASNRKKFWRFSLNSPRSRTVSFDWDASIFSTEMVVAIDLPMPASANTAVVPIEVSFKTSDISCSKGVSFKAWSMGIENWSSKGRTMFFIRALFPRHRRNFSQLP